MNKQIIKGTWNEISGKLKSAWGKITNDELEQIKGDHQQIYGILQKHYGYTKDQIDQELEKKCG